MRFAMDGGMRLRSPFRPSGRNSCSAATRRCSRTPPRCSSRGVCARTGAARRARSPSRASGEGEAAFRTPLSGAAPGLQRHAHRLRQRRPVPALASEQLLRLPGRPVGGARPQPGRVSRLAPRRGAAAIRALRRGRRLAQWARYWEAGREPAYAEPARATRAEYTELLLDLDRTLSAEQRTHAATRLRRYAGLFDALARQP